MRTSKIWAAVFFSAMVLCSYFLFWASNPQVIVSPDRTALEVPPSTVSGIKIVFLGDSLTEGYGIDSPLSYPFLIEKKLREDGRQNITVINAGQSGSTSASSLPRLRWILKSKDKPEILVLALGANDGLRGLDVLEMKKNLEATISLAQSHNIKVLLCGMMVPPNYTKEYSDQFYRVFKELGSRQEITFIPFLSPDTFSFFLKPSSSVMSASSCCVTCGISLHAP